MDPKELLEMLRSKLTDIAKNDASRQTKIRYGKAAERILEAGGLATYRPTTKSSWYFARAALKYYLYAHAALAYKNKDYGKTEELTRRAEIELQVPPPALRPTGRSSTKHRLQGLPVDWRAQIFAALPPAHRLPYAVQALAGARTAELAKGVKVHLYEGGIEITIAGAKLHKQNGQPLRQVVILNRPDDPVFVALFDAAQKTAPEPLQVAITTHIETYRKAIRNVGLRRFDRGRGTSKYITPYMVRHQFASDLKAAGLEPVLVAEALGHRSSRTQEIYGYKGLGQGGQGQDVEARASEPVRTYPKHTPDPQ
jgi:integrase